MSQRIVGFFRIKDLDERFVGGELKCREGDRHEEGGGIGDIKGTETFRGEDGGEAVADVAVGRLGKLHALFDDIKGVHEGVGGSGCAGSGGGWGEEDQ